MTVIDQAKRGMTVYLTDDMRQYIDSCTEELKQLIRDLCAIPAPSHHEHARAAFCREWFMRAGGTDAFIDDAQNVICPVGVTDDNMIDVYMAHTDTVFPDRQPMPFVETGHEFRCPGVVDDTANLAVMMICARYFIRRGAPKDHGVVFVANSCEEGLGNLKGCRAVCDMYRGRIRTFISFDGSRLPAIVTRAVGSHRYRVDVRTEGGHSFANFGNRNAIEVLASMIGALYRVCVPDGPGTHTTYNVGTIEGGTSVNTIAQHASMLYEYRSDDRKCLDIMKKTFETIVDMYRSAGADVTVQTVGERPCGGDVDPEAYARLLDACDRSVREVLGAEPQHGSGSTDANIPLSLGIPAVVLTAAAGHGCHTREETLDLHSLKPGCLLTMDTIARSFIEER